MEVREARTILKNFKVNPSESDRFGRIRVNSQMWPDLSYVVRAALELLWELGKPDGSEGQLRRVDGDTLAIATTAVARERANQRARQERNESIARQEHEPSKAKAKGKTAKAKEVYVVLEGEPERRISLTDNVDSDLYRRSLSSFTDGELLEWARQELQSEEWAAALVELVNREFPDRLKPKARRPKKPVKARPGANGKPKAKAKKGGK